MTRATRKRWMIGTVVALAVGIATAVAVGRYSQAKKKDDKAAVTLEFAPREVVQPAWTTMPGSIEFSGPLVAPDTAVVRAKAGGTLVGLAVQEGSHVKAGQSLGRIDLAELQSRSSERQASADAAKAALDQAERTHASNERLAQQSFISAIALETSRSQLDSARALHAAAVAALDTTRVGLREAALVAPIGGIVARRHVVPGEKVSIEQTLLTIVDLRRLELAGLVGTHEVGRLQPGMPVQVRVEGMAAPVTGQLARIAPMAEPGTRSIGVTIGLDNPKETLRAGQYALARVELADDARRLTVPLAAVGNTSGQEHVWVIADGALLRRAITTGRRDATSGRVEVLSGLAPEAHVLAARFDNLREGAKAMVVTDRAPRAEAAGANGTVTR
ncbi:MAG TPA: efflux RND transporter periplasmic adaptor subunit [Burkholderiaceae bacterium]|nr:efflux RND transporter periplasmic adaptor subunit [Burkholderiaceae bacterium]